MRLCILCFVTLTKVNTTNKNYIAIRSTIVQYGVERLSGDKKEGAYSTIYSWAYATAKTILEKRKEAGDGEDLVKRLIYSIRSEETPGRFLDKLATTLAEYRTNRAYNLNVNVHSHLLKLELRGDSFYFAKASILCGLLGALTQGHNKEAVSSNA